MIVDVFFRWLHVIAACLAIGGAFFLRIIVPFGLSTLDPEHREGAFLRMRRGFKFVVHGSVLALIVSGVYNTLKNWEAYKIKLPGQPVPKAVVHGLFGSHLLLGVAIFAISIVLLAKREPPRSHRTWMKVNIALMLLTVAVASALKWSRDQNVPRYQQQQIRVVDGLGGR